MSQDRFQRRSFDGMRIFSAIFPIGWQCANPADFADVAIKVLLTTGV
jgi:hypothetical protein